MLYNFQKCIFLRFSNPRKDFVLFLLLWESKVEVVCFLFHLEGKKVCGLCDGCCECYLHLTTKIMSYMQWVYRSLWGLGHHIIATWILCWNPKNNPHCTFQTVFITLYHSQAHQQNTSESIDLFLTVWRHQMQDASFSLGTKCQFPDWQKKVLASRPWDHLCFLLHFALFCACIVFTFQRD